EVLDELPGERVLDDRDRRHLAHRALRRTPAVGQDLLDDGHELADVLHRAPLLSWSLPQPVEHESVQELRVEVRGLLRQQLAAAPNHPRAASMRSSKSKLATLWTSR